MPDPTSADIRPLAEIKEELDAVIETIWNMTRGYEDGPRTPAFTRLHEHVVELVQEVERLTGELEDLRTLDVARSQQGSTQRSAAVSPQPRPEQGDGCCHQWVLISEKVAPVNAFKKQRRRRFYCSRCREIAEDRDKEYAA